MPIIYVHGVNVRSRQGFFAIRPYLEKIVAPAIADDPGSVTIDDVFWGDIGATFAWEGAARPRTRLLGQGSDRHDVSGVQRAVTSAEHAEVFDSVPGSTSGAPSGPGLISGGASASTDGQPPIRLKDLSPDELSDLLAAIIEQAIDSPEKRADLAIIGDQVARDPGTPAALASAASSDDELKILLDKIRARAPEEEGLIDMGIGDWWSKVRRRLGEAVDRATDLPAYAVSVALAEARAPVNDLVSVFLGDVFEYLDGRGDATNPGEIPLRLLEKLREAQEIKQQRNGEPLVVVTHSMGGQLLYDAITHFLPKMPAFADIQIDFWCASASQIGFFEESKWFLTSADQYKTGNPVPFPDSHLGYWWNVWDYNDFLSFTTNTIFEGVDDESYDSGMSLITAHGGYLQRPSFYRRFAQKLEAADAQDWRVS